MKPICPKLADTDHSPDFREWVPSSFESFLIELEHIINSCEGNDPVPLFRGQVNSEWLVDSTFVRNCIQNIFNIQDHHLLKSNVRQSLYLHKAIASLLMMKYEEILTPSVEANEKEQAEHIDPMYELLKHLQQYPENDGFIKGTFLLDWSLSKEIALYFATYQGKYKSRIINSVDGALWIFDAASTGRIMQKKKVGEILSLMRSKEFLNGDRGLPLIFHPTKQTFQKRSRNQHPVYIAQMNYRYDVADIWYNYEQENKKRVFVKLILKDTLKSSAAEYLKEKGITEEYIYPG